jgi:hypothetical protein
LSPCCRITILVLVSLLSLAASTGSNAGAGQRPPATPQPSALLAYATNPPFRALGSDGMEHLEYDLVITNVFTAPVTLTAIEVVASDGRQLLRLAGDALAANTQPIAFTDSPPVQQIPVSGVVAVVMDLVVPPGQVPPLLGHRIAYQLPSDVPGLTIVDGREITAPELVVDPRLPLLIAPPLRGAGWVNANGCCVAETPHRATRLAIDGTHYVKPETFAIDWVRLQGGRQWTGDGTQNAQHFAYSVDVVSVADGTVVSVRDDMPDETPRQPPIAVRHVDDYSGNHVVVQFQPHESDFAPRDVWALYAHLQPGSISVRVGERVTAGQRLGRLGNTGNSTDPHLHFQLSDGPDALSSNSLPFVFDRYTLAGTVAPEEMVAAYTDPGAPREVRIVGAPQAQSGTYPLVLTVQDFH